MRTKHETLYAHWIHKMLEGEAIDCFRLLDTDGEGAAYAFTVNETDVAYEVIIKEVG